MADLSSWLPNLLGPVEVQSNGTALTVARSKWNFAGSGFVTVSAADDSVNEATKITVSLTAGADTEVLFNSAGSLGASSSLTWQSNFLAIDVESQGSPIRLTDYATSTTGPGVVFRKARGTIAAPAQIQSGDTLGGSNVRGYMDAGGFSPGSSPSQWRFYALEAFTATAQGAGWALDLIAAGTTTRSSVVKATTAEVQIAAPIVGLGVAQGAVNGVGVQAMADADQTAAASVYQYAAIATTGALTMPRTLTLPGVSAAAYAYVKAVVNKCSGVGSVVVASTVGAGTVTIANGFSALVLIDANGATRLTADA